MSKKTAAMLLVIGIIVLVIAVAANVYVSSPSMPLTAVDVEEGFCGDDSCSMPM